MISIFIGLIEGIIFYVIFSFATSLVDKLPEGVNVPDVSGLGLLIIPSTVIGFGIGGWIFGAIGALLYNLSAKISKGIRLFA